MVAELPAGTVTFLFTDLEGSTRLWQEHPDAMRDALARHDELLRNAVRLHDGHVVKTTGDGLHAAFATAHDAVRAAVDASTALQDEPWEKTGPLKVRMGVHTGESEIRDGDYYGGAVNRAARVMSTAHGGQILVSLATAELVHDAGLDGVDLVDLGEHHLRDLARPEHLYQLVAPELPAEFPPLRTLDAFPTNLPLQPSSFVGRSHEVGELVELVGEHRLITLTGVGGVGKTRLALQVAAELLPRFADGAWFVELALVPDPNAVPEAIAAVLDVPNVPGKTIDEAIIEDLRRREVLLVVDNCEHVLDRVASIMGEIGRRCPRVAVLATSREGLALPGERIVAVPALGVPPGGASLDAARESAAVRLFVDRAAAARQGFALTFESVEGVVATCRRLDGVPLALELAAARVSSLSPAQIAERLDERFRLLTAGRRTAVERHQTLRATIDWSYDLLDEAEQRALQRLAVFAGGCTIDAAEAVVGGDDIDVLDVIDLVSRLVDQSLVTVEDADAEPRYRLLETIRQYAAERLADSGDLDATRERHARHYRALVEEIGPGLRGADEPAHRARFEVERENIRASLAWSVEHDDADGAFTIVLELDPLLVMESSLTVATFATLALETPSADADPRYPSVVAIAAEVKVAGGDFESGLALLAAADAAAVRSGTSFDYGGDLARLRILMVTGDLPAARTVCEAMMERVDSDDDAFFPNWGMASLAAVLVMQGERETGVALARDAVDLARRTRTPTTVAMTLIVYGWMLRDEEPERCREMMREALTLNDSPNGLPMAYATSNLFVLDARSGSVDACVAEGRRAAIALERSQQPGPSGDALAHLAVGFGALERFEVAGVLQGAAEAAAPYLAVSDAHGLQDLRSRAESVIGADGYEALLVQGRTMDKDAALDVLRAALDELEAEASGG